jgi:hypothetical protein
MQLGLKVKLSLISFIILGVGSPLLGGVHVGGVFLGGRLPRRFEFFEGGFDSFLHEEFEELVLADVSVLVAVDFAEDAADGLLGLLSFKELGDFLVADVAAVVDVEVFEGALVVLPLQVALGVEGGDHELSVLDLARPIQVDQPHHQLQPLLVLNAVLHHLLELSQTDRPVPVDVGALEDLLQAQLLSVAQQLRHGVSVHHCLQPVSKLNPPSLTPKSCIRSRVTSRFSGRTVAYTACSHLLCRASKALGRSFGFFFSMVMRSSLQSVLRSVHSLP